jgi:hypothetical protein
MAHIPSILSTQTEILQKCVEETLPTEDDSQTFTLQHNFGVLKLQLPTIEARTRDFHILFTLDCSGSMGHHLENVKKTLYNILEYLIEHNANTYVSIVFFNDTITPIIENEKLTQETYGIIKEKSKPIRAQRMTNVERVFEYVSRARNVMAENIHIFMTDGSPTAGESKPEKLSTHLTSYFDHYLLGFGADHNASLLYDLALRSNGHYYFIDAPSNSGLIYGEIIHKFLYRKYDVLVTSENRAIQYYDYKINHWVYSYKYGFISSDSDVAIHFKFDWDSNVDDLHIKILYNDVDGTQQHTKYIRFAEDDALHYTNAESTSPSTRNIDIEKYYYRQMVLETLYEGIQSGLYDDDLQSRVTDLFTMITNFCEKNNLQEDSFMKQLKDDLSIVHRTTMQHGDVYNSPFYLARHVSQGSQYAYNANNIDDIIIHQSMPHSPFRLQSMNTPYSNPCQTPMRRQDQFMFGSAQENPENGDTAFMSPLVSHTLSRERTTVYASQQQTNVMDEIQ